MIASEYRRSPLPKYAQTPVGWVAFCFLSLIFSPFVGFAIQGKVGNEGLVIGLKFALLPLAGLVVIAVRHWHAWQRLPLQLVEELKHGRVVTAEGAPVVTTPIRFADKKNWIEMLPEGASLSRHSVLSMPGVTKALERPLIAEQTGEMFIAWQDVVEWVVDTDSDGPDFYRLKLRSGGDIKVRRFRPDAASECGLLDAVRSVGKVPIRLCCDVVCH